jgi:ferredoxin
VRIQADQEKCASSGQCVKTAPDVFDQREYDGVVSLRTDRPSPEQTENVRYAALICPSRAITVIEELPSRLCGGQAGDADRPAAS